MHRHEHEGRQTLLMDSIAEISSIEGAALAKSALASGEGLTVIGLSIVMTKPDEVSVRYKGEQKSFPRTAAQTVDAIVAYQTPERILATLGN